MAEAATRNALGQISRDHLECPICCSRFANPKILDCLHSFCLGCLDELLNRQKTKTDGISCPVCRQVTAIPDTGLQGLMNSFVLSSLVDEFNKQELLLGGTSAPTSRCEDCDEGLEAFARCQDCDENICKICHDAHRRSKRTKNHRIVTVEDLNRKGIIRPTESDGIVPNCRIHVSYELCFYCKTCEMMICARCAASDHRTAEHEYTDISCVVRSFRHDVEEGLKVVERDIKELKAKEKSLEYSKCRLSIMVAQTCQDVSDKEEQEVAKIRLKSRHLREKVANIGQERNQKFEEELKSNRDKMNRAERVVASINNLMYQADDFEMLELKPKVMHNLDYWKLRNEDAYSVDRGMSFIGVKCHDIVGETDLGEILLEEKWQSTKEIMCNFTMATDVACMGDGKFAVTDLDKKEVTMLTSAGEQIVTSPVKVGDKRLEKPFGVTVTCDDLLWVTDTNQVKVLSGDLQMIRQFTPSQEDTEGRLASQLVGIYADKNRVAVVDRGRKAISLHKLDGSLITTIFNEMVDAFVAMSKDKIIFTNNTHSKLLCVDFEGNEVFSTDTVNGNSVRLHPCGVCCDEAGEIYVSTQSDKTESSEVHHYDSYGVYQGCVVCGLDHPFGIVFTPGGGLAVADVFSVKILRKF